MSAEDVDKISEMVPGTVWYVRGKSFTMLLHVLQNDPIVGTRIVELNGSVRVETNVIHDLNLMRKWFKLGSTYVRQI